MEKVNRITVFLKDKRKKNYFRILYEVLVLWITQRQFPSHYFKYQYRKSVKNYRDYLSNRESNSIKVSTNFHKEELLTIISSKLNFALFCKWTNLPVPTLASHNFFDSFYLNGEVFPAKTNADIVAFFNKVFDQTGWNYIFVKPVSLTGGYGCFRLSKANLVQDIEEAGPSLLSNVCIHEELVIQHPELNRIHPGCINTLRLETFIDRKGEVHFLAGFMRFGVGNNHVDNTHKGGLFVGIDMERGVLQSIGHQNMEYGGAEKTEHPETGTVFDGFPIPLFDETIAMVKHAVKMLPDRYIGWDVAVTPNGPLIIEANEYPNISSSEMVYGGYHKNPLFKEILKDA
ncbi:MAG: hypothetical protein RLZZ241_1009 [Bacteroidota bacterium]